MNIGPVQVLVVVAWPPTACTNDVGDFVEFAQDVEHVRTGYWRIPVVRVLLCFDRDHQVGIPQIGESAIVAGVI